MKLMLVDDHPLFLEGLQYLLRTYGIEVVGLAQDGKEAVANAKILQPDIILLDIKMPGLSGIDALRLIKAEMPDIKIVMLTSSEEDEDLFDAIKFGASGYLLKNTNANELMDTISDAMKGEAFFPRGLAGRILKEFRRRGENEDKLFSRYDEEKKGDRQGILSKRQLEILEMVARGITYKEAGEALGLTERTVKYHMGRIIELLHMENRAQVIAYAARIGLVESNKHEA